LYFQIKRLETLNVVPVAPMNSETEQPVQIKLRGTILESYTPTEANGVAVIEGDEVIIIDQPKNGFAMVFTRYNPRFKPKLVPLDLFLKIW
jgi:hypothetical protein